MDSARRVRLYVIHQRRGWIPIDLQTVPLLERADCRLRSWSEPTVHRADVVPAPLELGLNPPHCSRVHTGAARRRGRGGGVTPYRFAEIDFTGGRQCAGSAPIAPPSSAPPTGVRGVPAPTTAPVAAPMPGPLTVRSV